MAQVGSEEGSIEEGEKQLIHSIFEFGDTIVREVMVPRPDIIAIEDDKALRDVQALVLTHGTSRIPVYDADEDLDDVVGIVFAKDVLKALHQGKHDMPLADIVREAHYVPESKKVADLLKEMQREKFHMALVTDEYGSVTGLVSLEDLLEELVGEITDEYDREEPSSSRSATVRTGEREDVDRRRERAARARAARRGVGHGRRPRARPPGAHPRRGRGMPYRRAHVHRRRGQGPPYREGADHARRRHGAPSRGGASTVTAIDARGARAHGRDRPRGSLQRVRALQRVPRRRGPARRRRDLRRRQRRERELPGLGLCRAERGRDGGGCRRGGGDPRCRRRDRRRRPDAALRRVPPGPLRVRGPGMAVVAESADGSTRTYWSLDELLPDAFGPSDLDRPGRERAPPAIGPASWRWSGGPTSASRPS